MASIRPSGELRTLKDCFVTVIEGKSLQIKFSEFRHIVQHDLNMDLAAADPSTHHVLGKVLNYYMKEWPGWTQKKAYADGLITMDALYNKFHLYLCKKVSYVYDNIDSFWVDAEKECDNENKPLIDNTGSNVSSTQEPNSKATQTNLNVYSPYEIVISGSTSIMNNVYFTVGDNIVAKFHETAPLGPMTQKQILNHPYVSVNVTLPEISFSRMNTFHFERFIAQATEKIKTEYKGPTITNLDGESCESQVYTFEFMSIYFEQLFYILKEHTLIKKDRLVELQTIATQYLKDIEEVNQFEKTMSTNKMVCFNIGGSTYLRNKTWCCKEKPDTTIHFCEYVIPKISFSLKRLTAVQDMDSPEVSFTFLNRMNSLIEENEYTNKELNTFLIDIRSNEAISYSCTICNKVFSQYAKLYEHFEQEHNGCQDVICANCNLMLSFATLADNRWKHNCKKLNDEIKTE